MLLLQFGTCHTNENVDNCVQANLKNCHAYTGEYVAKLFSYTRELGKCSEFHDTVVNPGGVSITVI